MTHAAPIAAIVTGASGFVGRALARRLEGSDYSALPLAGDDWRTRIAAASWRDANVFHLAARVHEAGVSPALYERDNVDKTRAVAEAAARGRARRLVFLSSIKVNGEETREEPFRPDDAPAPADAYARSKYHAERAIAETLSGTPVSYVIVRSPLVIGPHPAGNLRALLRLAASRCPLPFGSIENRRTFIDVDDLAALLLACASASDVAGRLFLAGHPDACSTRRLISTIRQAWSRPAGLFRMDAAHLESLALLFGRRESVRRLTRSLEVDVSRTLQALPWSPAKPIDQAITQMALAHDRAGDTR